MQVGSDSVEPVPHCSLSRLGAEIGALTGAAVSSTPRSLRPRQSLRPHVVQVIGEKFPRLEQTHRCCHVGRL
jgi:hypothetical protein